MECHSDLIMFGSVCICLITFDLWVIVLFIFVVTTEVNTSVHARTHTKQT
jgi:hypothetical protein